MVDSEESQLQLIESSFHYQFMAVEKIVKFLDGDEKESQIQKIKNQFLDNIKLENEVKARSKALQNVNQKLKGIPDLKIDQVRLRRVS